MSRKFSNTSKVFIGGLIVALLATVALFFSVTASASEDVMLTVEDGNDVEVIINAEEYCAKLVDMIRGNDLMLHSNKIEIQLNLFDEAAFGEMQDSSVDMHAQILKSITIVSTENAILKEMYIDACED